MELPVIRVGYLQTKIQNHLTNSPKTLNTGFVVLIHLENDSFEIIADTYVAMLRGQ